MKERGFFLICDIIFWGLFITLLIFVFFYLIQLFQYSIDSSDYIDHVDYIDCIKSNRVEILVAFCFRIIYKLEDFSM